MHIIYAFGINIIDYMASVGELMRKYKITEDQAKTLMVLMKHNIAESTSAKLVTLSPKLVSSLKADIAAEIILKDLQRANFSLEKFKEIKEKKGKLKEGEIGIRRKAGKIKDVGGKKRRRR